MERSLGKEMKGGAGYMRAEMSEEKRKDEGKRWCLCRLCAAKQMMINEQLAWPSMMSSVEKSFISNYLSVNINSVSAAQLLHRSTLSSSPEQYVLCLDVTHNGFSKSYL